MKVLDPGHFYVAKNYDGEGGNFIRFMKREGDGYPGNIGHYAGTNLQEVIRVLIDRVKYLDNQVTDFSNEYVINHLRECLLLLEKRAAGRHGLKFKLGKYHCDWPIEDQSTCDICGHVVCKHVEEER